jgi:RNA polymerase sigma-70 factor (ECF subfamily)
LDALGKLCERFYPKILRYMHYRADHRVAEDLTAEVFMRVVRSIGQQTGSFRAWVYRIASNVAIDWLRRKRVRDHVSLEAAADVRSSAPDPAAAVGHRLDLAQAIDQLTEDQRELVTLKFIQGLSNAEIAEAMDRTAEAVRALQFRALAALRQILGHEEEHHHDEQPNA